MGIIGIAVIGAAAILFFGWWARRSAPTRANKTNKAKGAVDPSVELTLKAAMLAAEITQTERVLDQQIDELARGRLPADAEAKGAQGASPAVDASQGEKAELRALRALLEDPLLARPIPFLAEAVRADKAKALIRIKHEWGVFARLQSRYDEEPRPTVASGALVQLGLIEDLWHELSDLGLRFEVDALYELLVRHQRQVLPSREAVREQIALSRAELIKDAEVDALDLARAQRDFTTQLDLYDLQTVQEQDWPEAANAAGRIMQKIRQIADRTKLQAHDRRVLLADIKLFDAWLADLRRFTFAAIEEGYVPTVGSADGLLVPFERKYWTWKHLCEQRVELLGNESEELRALFRELCELGRHVGAWTFRQERNTYRAWLTESSRKLLAAYQVLRSGWAKEEGGIDAQRQGLLDQAEALQTEIRTYQETVLSRFCAQTPLPIESVLLPPFERFCALMGRVWELQDLAKPATSRLRPKTGVHKVAVIART